MNTAQRKDLPRAVVPVNSDGNDQQYWLDCGDLKTTRIVTHIADHRLPEPITLKPGERIAITARPADD